MRHSSFSMNHSCDLPAELHEDIWCYAFWDSFTIYSLQYSLQTRRAPVFTLVLRGHGLWESSRCRPGVPPGRGPGRTRTPRPGTRTPRPGAGRRRPGAGRGVRVTRTPTGTGRLVPIGTRDAASGSPGRHPDADREARTIWPSGASSSGEQKGVPELLGIPKYSVQREPNFVNEPPSASPRE